MRKTKSKNLSKYLLAVFAILLFTAINVNAQNNAVSYTLNDRDRMIRLEVEQKALRNEMNVKFDAMDVKFNAINDKFDAINDKFNAINDKFDAQNDKISDIKTFLYWGFGVLFSMMMILFGFVLWDRRTAITPVTKKTQALEEVLIEFSKKNPEFREILKKMAIL